MSNNPTDGSSEDFFDQILGFPAYAAADSNLAGNGAGGLAGTASGAPMMLQLSSGDGSAHLGGVRIGMGLGGVGGPFHGAGAAPFPLGLSLEQGRGEFMKMDESSASMKMDIRGSSSLKPVSIRLLSCFLPQVDCRENWTKLNFLLLFFLWWNFQFWLIKETVI